MSAIGDSLANMTASSFVVINGGETVDTKNFIALLVLSEEGELGNITFSNENTEDLTGEELPQGFMLSGQFTSVQVITGKVIAYQR